MEQEWYMCSKCKKCKNKCKYYFKIKIEEFRCKKFEKIIVFLLKKYYTLIIGYI